MQNRWRPCNAATHHNDLDLRAYSSRLMGLDPALVLHGGGNTSVKSSHTDRFGVPHDIIWVKASGYDLAQMWTGGFTALKLDQLLKLSQLDTLSDADMVNEVKCARLDAEAAAPSIEAIVHAVVPFKFVDHSHANAILTLSNSGQGREFFTEIFGDSVLVLPYVKPGFDLALQFRDVLEQGQFDRYDVIILEQHGVFTFADTAKASYDRMITVVDQAEQFLNDRYGPLENGPDDAQNAEFVAKARKYVSEVAGRAVL